MKVRTHPFIRVLLGILFGSLMFTSWMYEQTAKLAGVLP